MRYERNPKKNFHYGVRITTRIATLWFTYDIGEKNDRIKFEFMEKCTENLKKCPEKGKCAVLDRKEKDALTVVLNAIIQWKSI